MRLERPFEIKQLLEEEFWWTVILVGRYFEGVGHNRE